jgi:hypothetical protein
MEDCLIKIRKIIIFQEIYAIMPFTMPWIVMSGNFPALIWGSEVFKPVFNGTYQGRRITSNHHQIGESQVDKNPRFWRFCKPLPPILLWDELFPPTGRQKSAWKFWRGRASVLIKLKLPPSKVGKS